jgi:beta-N-acetylglucosaminidase
MFIIEADIGETDKQTIMADNKEIRDGRDRSRVAGNEEYELQYLAEKTGASIEEVRQAIEQVGNDRAKLEEHLMRNR